MKHTTLAALVALGSTALVGQSFAMSFNQYLGDTYSSLAKFENQPSEEDIEDAIFLEKQAKRAYSNETPFTLHPMSQDNPIAKTRFVQDTQERLTGIRSLLEAHLAAGTASTHPVPLANAMANFDCWVEQQESEKNSRHNVNSCLNGLEAALAQLPALNTAVVPTTQTVVQTQTAELNLLDTVYFMFDKSDLTQESRRKIDALESKVKRADRGQIVIVGHADRSGSVDYNQALSERRANSVAQYMNLPAGTFRVETDAKGETMPAVKTADGVKEQANRRVTISVEAEKEQQVKQTIQQ